MKVNNKQPLRKITSTMVKKVLIVNKNEKKVLKSILKKPIMKQRVKNLSVRDVKMQMMKRSKSVGKKLNKEMESQKCGSNESLPISDISEEEE